MRTAYYTAVENIPICKSPSLLKLQRQNGCQSLCDLKMGENATYESRYMLDACVEVIQTNISKKISDSEFISIMTDESTDIVVKKKCVIYCIVVNENLERQVMFLGNVEVDEVSVTAEVLFNHLKSYLVEKGVSGDKVIGFGSDGASIMTGKKNGVATRFKKVAPHMIAVHCMAHRLNLSSSKSTDSVPYLKNVFQETLKDLFHYFSKSTARTTELKQIQAVLDSPQVTMKEMYEVRCMACYNALNAVFHSWKPLVSYFKKHKSDSKRCEKLFNALTSYTFIRVVYMMMDVIPSLTALNMVFQKQDLDIAVQPAIDGFFSAVDGASTGKSYYQRELKSLLKKCDGNTVKLENLIVN